MNLIAYYARRVRTAVGRMQVRGHPLLPSILLVLPRITVVRGYRHAARRFTRLVFDAVNGRRIRRVSAAQMNAVGDAFYVIVMPGTLRFLLPCLALLPRHL